MTDKRKGTTIGEEIAEGRDRKYVINFFGWCFDPAKKHDKIWGWVTFGKGADRKVYNFWGRRGKRIKFKLNENAWGDAPLMAVTKRKMRPRETGQYEDIAVERIEEVYPDFYNSFEKQLVLAKLFDRIRGEGDYGKVP